MLDILLPSLLNVKQLPSLVEIDQEQYEEKRGEQGKTAVYQES
jgi:hypothetical protein